jgi:arginyl-tRNA synthetase
MSIYATYDTLLGEVLDALEAEGTLPAGLNRKPVAVEPPRDASHGDLATNAAMVLAKGAGTNPRALAALIAPKLKALPDVTEVSVAGPGFINVRLSDEAWRRELAAVLQEGDRYGLSTVGAGERVNVEYVSANPTGPMHMGHCRGAVVGDALASLLEAAGFAVTREYYVNDAGSQVDTLARSAHLRYREALGHDIGAIPEGLYPGDYLVPVGQALAAFGPHYADAPEDEWLDLFKRNAVAAMIELIKHDLALLGIHHDKFASEAELQAAGAPERAEATLRAKGLVYQASLKRPKAKRRRIGSRWELTLFRSTEFGDDQDRPMKKSNGDVDLFRCRRSLSSSEGRERRSSRQHLGRRPCGDGQADQGGSDCADRRAGRSRRQDHSDGQIAACWRADQDVQAVGQFRDVGRRRGRGRQGRRPLHDADQARRYPLEFDFAKVVEASKDNPVFYVQYAHARIASLQRKAAEIGISLDTVADMTKLDAEELGLVKLLAQYPRTCGGGGAAHEPHRIAFILMTWHLRSTACGIAAMTIPRGAS